MVARPRPSTCSDARAARRLRRANNSLQWQDVDAVPLATSSVASSFAKLPLSIVRDRILRFLAPPPSLEDIKSLSDGVKVEVYKKQLLPLGLVCQQWYKLIQLLERRSRTIDYVVTFKDGTRDERTRILKSAKREGKDAKQLTISMGTNTWFGPFRMYVSVADEDLTLDQAWWDALFQCFPSLVRLDLTHMSKAFIGMALISAGRFCPRLQALQFQFAQGRAPDTNAEMHASSMAALEQALRGWHDSNGGLRSLSIPRWVYTDARYTRFIATVAASCPNVEYLRHTGGNMPLTSHAMTLNGLAVPGDVWADFSRRCTKLREFSWRLVAFTVGHARNFIAHPKPLLRTRR